MGEIHFVGQSSRPTAREQIAPRLGARLPALRAAPESICNNA
jgi:hypothetical protein